LIFVTFSEFIVVECDINQPDPFFLRTLRVTGIPKSRVGAKLVADYCDDQTPASEFEKAKTQRVQQVLARDKGTGRPTKRDRRLLDKLFGRD